MKIIIDLERKEVTYPKDVTLQELGSSLSELFVGEGWKTFKIMINERYDENSNSEVYDDLPF